MGWYPAHALIVVDGRAVRRWALCPFRAQCSGNACNGGGLPRTGRASRFRLDSRILRSPVLGRWARKDEPLILEFLAENLRADDFSVLTAASSGEAIHALAAARPDVVLLDVVLPDMSGYDVCRRVREGDSVNDPWTPVPIFMLSAKAEHTDRVRGFNRGVDDYVTKPHSLP
jgi:CheY-like chemotaxis protein